MDTTFANISTLTDNLNKTLSKQKIDALTGEISEALQNIRKLSENADAQLQQAKLAETTEAIRELKSELSNTADKLNHTLDAVTELAGSIDDDPGSLIRGRAAEKNSSQ
jgi:ABC-type transporter Mla subunit MlaD